MAQWTSSGSSSPSGGGNTSSVTFQTSDGVLSYNAATVGVNLGGKTIYSVLINGTELYLVGLVGINGSGTVNFSDNPGVALCSISYDAS